MINNDEVYQDMYQRDTMMSSASTSMGMSQPYGYPGYPLFPFASYPYPWYDFGPAFMPPYANEAQMNDMYRAYMSESYFDQMHSQANAVDQSSSNMVYDH